jgi:Rho GTPase-activating protein RGD1
MGAYQPDQRQPSQLMQSQPQGFGAVVQAPAIFPSQSSQQAMTNLEYSASQYSIADYPRLRPVFGMSLEELLGRDESVVPIIVLQCVQAVDLYGLDVEGIYRLSGEKKHVERLKQIFDNGLYGRVGGLICWC